MTGGSITFLVGFPDHYFTTSLVYLGSLARSSWLGDTSFCYLFICFALLVKARIVEATMGSGAEAVWLIEL